MRTVFLRCRARSPLPPSQSASMPDFHRPPRNARLLDRQHAKLYPEKSSGPGLRSLRLPRTLTPEPNFGGSDSTYRAK
jgi:hypothetical protein